MNSEWQNFLEQQGATIAEGAVHDYGDPTAELKQAVEGDSLCDLSHDALIRASGEEAGGFLQGQLTNDVRSASTTRHQLGSYCSPKGRMLALFRLFMRDEAYCLQLPASLLAPTLKRLQMFVLMAKVQLEDASDELARFALAGPSAEKLLQKHLGAVPVEEGESLSTDGITQLRIPGPQPRYILHGSFDAMQTLWQSLHDDGATPVGAEAGRLLDIHAGLPVVYPDTVEAFVPQMVNLQLIGGVSFKKGCYTGQEVVARMQYLGKLKRRMYLAHVDSEQPPQPGDELTSPHSASGQGAGKVVSAAAAPQGGYDLLCVIEIAAADSGEVYLGEIGGAALTLESPPYGFEPQQAAS
ncbi:MAG: folate-binding protein YgfZ [Gammaproteobacteria bacterium]|nr:folate-binding protein YgfZ [Gammaproteobacteria bacterium]